MEVKQMLASATRLAHPAQAAKLSLAVDASETHIGACPQQKRAGSPGWEPLGFFSKKLEPALVKYSAFDRELLAYFLGIHHFRFMLEGRAFTIYTDHKPLTTAINCTSDPWMARHCRQLAYVAEYTSDICHIAGTSNVVANALSQPPIPPSPSPAAACVKAPSRSQAAARREGKSNSSSPSAVASVVAHVPLGGVDYATMAAAQGFQGCRGWQPAQPCRSGKCRSMVRMCCAMWQPGWPGRWYQRPSGRRCSPPSMGWHTPVSGRRDAWCQAGSCGTGAPQTWPDGAGTARPGRGEK
jgi:hypothetical protein